MTEATSKADLHLHTTWSDGTASVPQVLARAARAELRVIAITDHDTITGVVEARRLARDFGVEVVVGEEVSTREGHLLALFIETPVPPQRPAVETIAAVHAQGGLCVAPHPFDKVSICFELSEPVAPSGILHRLIGCRTVPKHVFVDDGSPRKTALNGNGAVTMCFREALEELVAKDQQLFPSMERFSKAKQC